MARETRNPELGQMALDIPPVPAEVKLDARNAFATAAKPAFHGLRIETYAELTPAQVDYVTPEFLENSLLHAPRESANSIYYRNPETKEVRYVAVTPGEYKLLAGNLVTLGNRATSHVLDSRTSGLPRDVDVQAAERGGVHAVTAKLDILEKYRQNILNKQIAETNWLAHANHNPGRAWKKGFNLREMITNFRTFVFDDMLVAMSQSGAWSEDKARGVRDVIEYKLFFDRNDNQHLENWGQLLAVTSEYLGTKRAIFDEKIVKARKYIDTHAEQAD